MMSVLFTGMIFFSVVFAILGGRMPELCSAVLTESSAAVELILKILGSMCLWSGVMEVAEQSGLTAKLSALFSPLTRLLFRGLPEQSPAMRAIAMNFTANLLGLGNAATPLGISAMQAMEKQEHTNGTASNNMVLFVVMNTASIQLIPTTTAMLRLQNGSADPMGILPAVWLASAVSVASGICMAKLLQKFWR